MTLLDLDLHQIADNSTDQFVGQFVGQRVAFHDGETAFGGQIVATGTPDQIVGRLSGGDRALIVLPFDPSEEALAHHVRTDLSAAVAPHPGRSDGPERPQIARAHSVTEQPESARFAEQVREALSRIEAGELSKIVLGRGLDVRSVPALSADEILDALVASRPGRFVFSVPTGEGHLIGASPELLVERRGTSLTSLPLAGSAPRVSDPIADQARSATLAASTKDLVEHRYVVDQIVDQLTPYCTQMSVPKQPELLATDSLWHLATPITATLAEPAPTTLDLAGVLHPTPAMAGVPTADAIRAIAEIEGHSRGPFTGAVGWVDANGDGQFALVIRSGLLNGSSFRLFAGAGIVAGSDPDSEVAETGAKLSTMLKAIGAR